MIYRICTKCKLEKSLDNYTKNKYHPGGLDCWCKECKKINKKEYYKNHKKLILEITKNYRINNSQKVSEIQRNYRNKNKEKLKQYFKKYQVINKDKISKYWKERYKILRKDPNWLKKEKIRKQIYSKNNKEKIREYQKKNRLTTNKRYSDRRKNDIRFKLLGNLRNRIVKVIRKSHKSLSTMFLIGCEIDYLMYHLQSQFKPGMTWDNYGVDGWTIDHIKPCSLFDLSKPEEQKICFHYTNLQPLWWKDNRSKGVTYALH